MSFVQNSFVKNTIADLAVYTAVDSLRAKSIDFDNIPENAIAVVSHHLLLKNVANGKLSGLLDATSSAIVEDYVSRFVGLYLGEMILGHHKEWGTLAKNQLFYSVGIYLANAGMGQFGLNKPATEASPNKLRS